MIKKTAAKKQNQPSVAFLTLDEFRKLLSTYDPGLGANPAESIGPVPAEAANFSGPSLFLSAKVGTPYVKIVIAKAIIEPLTEGSEELVSTVTIPSELIPNLIANLGSIYARTIR